jgi:hypothetical protein
MMIKEKNEALGSAFGAKVGCVVKRTKLFLLYLAKCK